MTAAPVLVVGDPLLRDALLARRSAAVDVELLPATALLDPAGLTMWLAERRPDIIFQAAALGPGLTAEATSLELLVVGTTNLLEAVRAAAPGARVVLAATDLAIGAGDDDQPLPDTGTAVAQAVALLLGPTYVANRGLDVVTLRVPADADAIVAAERLWAAAG